MKNIFYFASILLLIYSCGFATPKEKTESGKTRVTDMYETTGKIEILDDAFLELIPRNAKIEILAEGFSWSEGPVWVEKGDYLIFSDVPKNKIFKWKAGEGLSVYLEESGYTGASQYSGEEGSNGLLIDAEGNLLLCQHGRRQLAKMDAPLNTPKASYVTLADNFEGKKFNSPNDLARHKDGSIYFTDPPYGLPHQGNTPLRELDFYGVYKVDTAGKVSLLADNLSRPNGIAFSPDFTVCYVTQSDPEKAIIMAYELAADGSFENERIFFDATSLVPTKKGLPDGLKVHPAKGYIFSTGPGGVLVLSPEGNHLGTINTGQATANCAFDAEYNYLYMTAHNYLMRVQLNGLD